MSATYPDLPQNTLVVLPKPLPMNRGAFWVLFWTIGLLMGLFAREAIDGTTRGAGPSRDAAAVEAPIGTLGVEVRAILELPSPTATISPRPTATASPDPAGAIDYCGIATPGALCRVPYPPPPTPTPYPLCPDIVATPVLAGDLCVWPTPPAEGDRP